MAGDRDGEGREKDGVEVSLKSPGESEGKGKVDVDVDVDVDVSKTNQQQQQQKQQIPKRFLDFFTTLDEKIDQQNALLLDIASFLAAQQGLPEPEMPPPPPKKVLPLFDFFTTIDERIDRSNQLLQAIRDLLQGVAPTLPGIAPPAPAPAPAPEVDLSTTNELLMRIIALLESPPTPPAPPAPDLTETNELLRQVASYLDIQSQLKGAVELYYPRGGGTKSLPAGETFINLWTGEVVLPDRSTEKMSTSLRAHDISHASSLVIYASDDIEVTLDRGVKTATFTVHALSWKPILNRRVRTLSITASDDTEVIVIASTLPMGITVPSGRTHEVYTGREKKVLSLSTTQASFTFSRRVHQIVLYNTGADAQVDFDTDVDADSFLIPNGGSLSLAVRISDVRAKTSSGTSTLYILGLRR